MAATKWRASPARRLQDTMSRSGQARAWCQGACSVYQGSDPGGGKRGPLQEKKSSESVRAAGRPGPADPVATTFLYTIWQRDQVVFWIYYQSKSRPTENYPLCHAGLSYRRCFPYSDRNSHSYSFLSPTFELASFPHLHPAILLLSTHSSRGYGSKRYGLTSSSVIP